MSADWFVAGLRYRSCRAPARASTHWCAASSRRNALRFTPESRWGWIWQDQAGETLSAPNRGQAAEAEVLLYRLRNAGLADPDSALTELEKLRGQWWYDGANSEAATAIAGELNLVKALRSNSR